MNEKRRAKMHDIFMDGVNQIGVFKTLGYARATRADAQAYQRFLAALSRAMTSLMVNFCWCGSGSSASGVSKFDASLI
ncbi:MAG: hypothetical protein U5K75_06305 [Ahrensia sp.]|nr:hypothetical protein [Ahrensia sp.]